MRSFFQLTLLRAAASLSRLAVRLEGEEGGKPSRSFELAASRTIADAARRGGPTCMEGEVAPGFVAMRARGQMPSPLGPALLLVDEPPRSFIPVFVGGSEALAFKHRLEGSHHSRPLAYDLLDRLLQVVEAEVRRVAIHELRDDVFIASVQVALADGRVLELDARASDAIILATGRGLAVMVAQPLIDSVARPLDSDMIGGLQ